VRTVSGAMAHGLCSLRIFSASTLEAMWLMGRGSGMFEYFLPLFASYSWIPSSNMREVDFEFEIVPETIDGHILVHLRSPGVCCVKYSH